jgi:hypothetical protein
MDASYLVYVFAGRIPMFLLLLGGIIFAMTRWNRHPKVSFLTILGLLFYLLETTFFTFTIYLLPALLPTGGPLAVSERFYDILYITDDIAYSAILIVLVAAVFTQRASGAASSTV